MVNKTMSAWMGEASPSDEVADTILQDVTSKVDVSFRYPVGINAVTLLEKKNSMSDELFHRYMTDLMSNRTSSPKARGG
jgi:hypothetical protein